MQHQKDLPIGSVFDESLFQSLLRANSVSLSSDLIPSRSPLQLSLPCELGLPAVPPPFMSSFSHSTNTLPALVCESAKLWPRLQAQHPAQRASEGAAASERIAHPVTPLPGPGGPAHTIAVLRSVCFGQEEGHLKGSYTYN